MSALTTLFSSLANKIRSKTGGSDTYTPPEMVDAIDDVYDAGVASATTPITPSNASPASMTSGTGYKPTANGYAIESYDSVTPSSSPASVSSGDVVKIGGSGVIVDAVPTPTSITPSNSSPVALTADTPVNPTVNGYAIESYSIIIPSYAVSAISAGSIYKANGYGYAIGSYQSKTPSTSGVSFDSGFVKMSSSGYAYSDKPTLKATTLYTNSSPSTSVTSGTVTLSQDIDNFDYIEIQCVVGTGSTSSYLYSGKFAVSDWKTMTSDSGKYAVVNFTNSNYRFDRMFYYSSDTVVGYTTCQRHNASASSAQSAYIIPYKIYGYKISA